MIWSNSIKKDDHGINLKSPDEIELFEHFFNDKKMFSHQLKNILRHNKMGQLSITLKRISLFFILQHIIYFQ